MSKSSQAFRTIREVSDWLDVKAHVLRFWESKFPQIKPVKRAGGRRYYRPGDMELVGGIKVLLHEQGMTIKGVQNLIRDEGTSHVASLSPPIDMLDFEDAPSDEIEAWDRELAADAVEDAEVLPSETEETEPALAETNEEVTGTAELAAALSPALNDETAEQHVQDNNAPEFAFDAPDAPTDQAPAEHPVDDVSAAPETVAETAPAPDPVAAMSLAPDAPAEPSAAPETTAATADLEAETVDTGLAAADEVGAPGQQTSGPEASSQSEDAAASAPLLLETREPTMSDLIGDFAEVTARIPALSPEARAALAPLLARCGDLAARMSP